MVRDPGVCNDYHDWLMDDGRYRDFERLQVIYQAKKQLIVTKYLGRGYSVCQ